MSDTNAYRIGIDPDADAIPSVRDHGVQGVFVTVRFTTDESIDIALRAKSLQKDIPQFVHDCAITPLVTVFLE